MECSYHPHLGQVVLLEGAVTDPGQEPIAAVVAGVVDGVILLDLTCSAEAPPDGTRMVTSHFAPEALYRLTATVRHVEPGIVGLHDCDHLETIQRRRWPRRAAVMPVVLLPADDDGLVGVRGETVDIGVGGAQVATTDRLPPATDPLVALTMPEGDTLVLKAVVVATEHRQHSWAYRLAFQDLDEMDVARLAELTRRAPKAAHAGAPLGG